MAIFEKKQVKEEKLEGKNLEDKSLQGKSRFGKEKITNGLELIESGYVPKTPAQRLRDEILIRLNSSDRRLRDVDLFTNTIVNQATLESLVSALIAGNNILLFGPPGSGKTNLAKDIWHLFPKEVYVVDGCPVQDDPFSLINEEFGKQNPPCPLCKMKYGKVSYESLGEFSTKNVNPASVPVRRTVLREGYGFARLQGSSEVYADNLTGNINIHKLEKIGDPTSPEILEPGKLLQANRGVLIIDEVGKLPRGTQNVLLQALQEKCVSPAKSRETFPASFVAVTTSNLDDLDNINEPLADRLTKIHMGFPKLHESNKLIIQMAFAREPPAIFIPDIFVDACIKLVSSWRASSGENVELSEVGSNRTMVDIMRRSEAYAILEGKEILNLDNFKKGAKDSMLGRIRARGGDSYQENKRLLLSFLDKHLENSFKESCREYWCEFFTGILKRDQGEAKKLLSEFSSLVKDLSLVKDGKVRLNTTARCAKFASYIQKREVGREYDGTSDYLIARVYKMLEETSLFECPEKK